MSNTRQRIEWIVKAAPGVKIFETNLFTVPTGRAKELDSGDRRTEAFEHMVSKISPEALLPQRKPVEKDFEGHHHCVSLTENFSDAFIYEKPVKIAAIPHLFNTSERRATELGKAIRELFLNGQGSSIRGAKSRVDL
jgi:hypothetical protein